MLRRLQAYAAFVRECLALLAEQKLISAIFLGLSVLGALTEGMTISLLVPILEAQGGPGAFSHSAILGDISSLFAGYTPSGRIEAAALIMVVVVIVRTLLQYAVNTLGATIPLRIAQKLNLRGYAALMAVEIAYINNNDYGDLVYRVDGLAQRVSTMLSSFAVMVWNLFIVIIYVGLMLSVSWRLTAAAVAFLLLMSFILRWISSGPLRRLGAIWSAASSRVNQVLMESVTGIKMIRLAAAEPQMRLVYAGAVENANRSQRRAYLMQMLSSPLLSLTASLFICALLFGDAVVHEGEPTTWVSSIILFLFLLFRLMGPVGEINAARARVVVNLDAFDALNAFYRETEARAQVNGTRPVGPLRSGIAFDHVTFTYNGGERQAIRDVSMTIERGKTVAIVGPSGAGKSTVIALVARLYDPQQGRILVDGVDLRELDLRGWRKRLAAVTQEIIIFNDTVARNIAFGREDVSDERIRDAARLAAADEFISELPQGYDTLLGDRGVRLSGGQQQRVAIARAILADPDLLILDEATSHLDSVTERAIQSAVEKMSKDRTVLIIAHRLSTVRKADKVVVLDEGCIVEEGRHADLIARRGAYWEMVEHQRLDLVDGDADATQA
jgi:ATP-binding cassette, subfamily B, bacterial MsbA